MEALAYTLAEAAKRMHISEPVLRTLVHRPDFPAFRVGKRWMIPDVDLKRWLSDRAAEKAEIEICNDTKEEQA